MRSSAESSTYKPST